MKNRYVIVCLMSLALGNVSRGASAKSDKGDEDVQALTILAKNCAPCHQAADHPGALFLNKARLSEPQTIALIEKLVKTSQMPPAHVKFKDTKDGKALLEWLKRKNSGTK